MFANSAVASVLILLHAYQLHQRDARSPSSNCYSLPGDLLIIGIVANYASVAADTFSSELGILSKSQPRLITSLTLRRVPPGTNGGVTIWGLVAGLLGSSIIVCVAMPLIPFCDAKTTMLGQKRQGWTTSDKLQLAAGLTVLGACGSLLDSFLGGWFQRSVVDTRSGRIVEGEGGKTVLVYGSSSKSMHYKKAEVQAKLRESEGEQGAEQQSSFNAKQKSSGEGKPSRVVESGGLGLLNNNDVNLLMALSMSLSAMAVAGWYWNVPLKSIFAT